ncbi:23230_t:CDS:2 [Entrophospora sp. SA101]|nr:10213_t:CDS:2 [Entrophospora sp. SA101]CAJ0761318.1 23230_t:CDS:2 [Entrophospora sp. SA101]
MEVDNLNSKRKELNEEIRGQIVVTHTTSSASQPGRPKLIGEKKNEL